MAETYAQQICAKSRNRKTSVKIELLDNNDIKVDELTGDIISGNICIKNGIGSSFSRRSGSIELRLTKALSINYYKIDLLHKVRISIIVKDNIRKVSAEYNMGQFLMNSPSILKSTTDAKITISLLDLMANFDGTFGKSVDPVLTAKITSGTPIINSITQIATDITLMGLPNNKIKVESTNLVTIENIEVSPESNITDFLSDVMEDCLNYDLYFDENGYLIFESIKQRDNDVVYQEFNNSNVVVSYEINEDFGNVRNVIHMLGAQIESSEEATVPIQTTGIARLDDANNPLSTVNIGEKPITLTNDKLQTELQCNNEAQYELEQRSYYKEKIVIVILPDFRLSPNRKIKLDYISEDESLEIHGSFLIDQIDIDLKNGGLMNLNCHKLYPSVV